MAREARQLERLGDRSGDDGLGDVLSPDSRTEPLAERDRAGDAVLRRDGERGLLHGREAGRDLQGLGVRPLEQSGISQQREQVRGIRTIGHLLHVAAERHEAPHTHPRPLRHNAHARAPRALAKVSDELAAGIPDRPVLPLVDEIPVQHRIPEATVCVREVRGRFLSFELPRDRERVRVPPDDIARAGHRAVGEGAGIGREDHRQPPLRQELANRGEPRLQRRRIHHRRGERDRRGADQSARRQRDGEGVGRRQREGRLVGHLAGHLARDHVISVASQLHRSNAVTIG